MKITDKIKNFSGHYQKYKDEEIVNDVLSAAMATPSLYNKKPWEFIVINNKRLFSQLEKVTKYNAVINNSRIIIIVLGKKDEEMDIELLEQDLTSCTENIILKAVSKKKGCTLIPLKNTKEISGILKKNFNIPEDLVAYNLIALGKRKQKGKKDYYFDENKVHYEKY